MAYTKELILDKEQTSYNDLFDAFETGSKGLQHRITPKSDSF